MEVQTCLDQKAWILAINDWLADRKQRYSARRLFVPAGQTPVPLYAQWEKDHPEFLSDLHLLQVDEVLGRPPVFRIFLAEHLPSYVGQIEFIEQADGGADLAILGLGLNGHVAFHEPGLPASFFSGCVLLQDSTCHTLGMSSPAWGVTYGLGAFLRTRAVALIVRGNGKRAVVERLLSGDRSLPATYLLAHADVTLFVDFVVKHANR